MEHKLWNKNYVLLLQGSWVSAIGNVLYSICIGYWVYEQTQSTALMGSISSISMFMMVLSPICGAIVDRSNRKVLIVLLDLIRGIVMIGLGIIAYMNQLSVFWVIVVAFISAFCNVLFNPCSTSVFADVLPKDELIRGQSIYNGGYSLISLAGQSLSGMLIVIFGVPLLILLNGICYVISAITECFIEVPKTEKQGLEINVKSIFSDLKEGLYYSLHEKGLNTIMFCALAINFLGSGIFSLFLPFCYEKGLDVVQYGYLSSVITVAGLCGVFVIGIWKMKSHKRFMIMMSTFIVSSVLQALGYLGIGFWLIAGLLFFSQLLNAIANAIFNAAMIISIPHDKRGVIIGFISAASTCGMALSTVVYGVLAEVISLSWLGVIGTLLSLIPFVILGRDSKVKEFVNEGNN